MTCAAGFEHHTSSAGASAGRASSTAASESRRLGERWPSTMKSKLAQSIVSANACAKDLSGRSSSAVARSPTTT
jgi:hypothetical protein